MSIAVSTAIGIGAAVGTGAASVYAAKKQSSANEKAIASQERSNREAGDAQAEANREALQFEREKEARRQQEWDRTMVQAEAQWNAEQARLAPYRAASEGALSQLVSLAGLPAYTPSPVEKPDFSRPIPEAWQPGDPTGLEGTFEGRAGGGVGRSGAVRRPTSSQLTDLLSDPATGGALVDMAEAMGGESVAGGRPAPAQGARVSPEAYRRITEAPGATAPTMVGRAVAGRPRPRVADLVRPRDLVSREEEV